MLSFLAGQLHVFRPRTDLALVFVAMAPLVGAAWIAISRLEDYRHDVFDVTGGSLLGLLTAYFSYRRYYPSLRSPICHQLYPSRNDSAFRKHHSTLEADEEQGLNRGARESMGDSVDVHETYPLKGMAEGS